MAVFALTNAFIYGGSHDYTGDSNEVRLACEAEALDKTTMRSDGWREFANGLKNARLELVPGAGHLVELEEPEKVAALISNS